MKIIQCSVCNNHRILGKSCPNCSNSSQKSMPKRLALAAILGLGMTACGSKEEDSSSQDASIEAAAEPSEPAIEPEYGVAEG